MKFQVGEFTKEGFVTAYAIKFGNGLTLRTTGDLCWADKAVREETKKQFDEVVELLKQDGSIQVEKL